MKISQIYEGKDISGDFSDPFCRNGMVQVEAALKRYGSDKIAQLEKLDKLRKRFNEFTEKVRSGKVDMYEYFRENIELSVDLLALESFPSSLNEELAAECDSCGHRVFFKLRAEPVKLADSLTNEEIAALPLPNDAVLSKVGVRMGFASFEDFKKWLSVFVNVKKASAVLQNAVAALNKLNDSDIRDVADTVRQIPQFLERKAYEKRTLLLKMVEEQVRIDKER